MASRANDALVPLRPAQKRRWTWQFGDALNILVIIYYLFTPAVDVLAGFLETFYDIKGVAVVYKGGTLFLLAMFLIAGRIRSLFALISLVVIALLVTGAGMRQSIGMGGFTNDLIFIARGPMLLGGALSVLLALSQSDMRRVATAYFVATWMIMTLSILITNWLGISLTTYSAGYGARGFYQAANEITLAYVLCWWFLVTRVAKNYLYKFILTAITIWLIYTLGTKSGFVLIPILSLWYVQRWWNLTYKSSFALFVCVSLFAVAYADAIFLAVLPYLPAADTFMFFIDTYGVGTALTGGRFYQIQDVINIMASFNWTEILFGIGFDNFWFAIDGSSVESDIIDTFGGGGLIFSFWFYGLLIWGYVLSKTKLDPKRIVDTEWATVFVAVVMYSVFVGHVAFAATPLITVAMFVGLTYQERQVENRHRAVVVQ